MDVESMPFTLRGSSLASDFSPADSWRNAFISSATRGDVGENGEAGADNSLFGCFHDHAGSTDVAGAATTGPEYYMESPPVILSKGVDPPLRLALVCPQRIVPTAAKDASGIFELGEGQILTSPPTVFENFNSEYVRKVDGQTGWSWPLGYVPPQTDCGTIFVGHRNRKDSNCSHFSSSDDGESCSSGLSCHFDMGYEDSLTRSPEEVCITNMDVYGNEQSITYSQKNTVNNEGVSVVSSLQSERNVGILSLQDGNNTTVSNQETGEYPVKEDTTTTAVVGLHDILREIRQECEEIELSYSQSGDENTERNTKSVEMLRMDGEFKDERRNCVFPVEDIHEVSATLDNCEMNADDEKPLAYNNSFGDAGNRSSGEVEMLTVIDETDVDDGEAEPRSTNSGGDLGAVCSFEREIGERFPDLIRTTDSPDVIDQSLSSDGSRSLTKDSESGSNDLGATTVLVSSSEHNSSSSINSSVPIVKIIVLRNGPAVSVDESTNTCSIDNGDGTRNCNVSSSTTAKVVRVDIGRVLNTTQNSSSSDNVVKVVKANTENGVFNFGNVQIMTCDGDLCSSSSGNVVRPTSGGDADGRNKLSAHNNGGCGRAVEIGAKPGDIGRKCVIDKDVATYSSSTTTQRYQTESSLDMVGSRYKPYRTYDGYSSKRQRFTSGGSILSDSGYSSSTTTSTCMDRKKKQNRVASHRYRLRLKQEKQEAMTEIAALEAANGKLKSQTSELEREIAYLRRLMSEVRDRAA